LGAADFLVTSGNRTTSDGKNVNGHHGVSLTFAQNILVTRFNIATRMWHDIGVDMATSLSVYSHGEGVDLNLDNHRSGEPPLRMLLAGLYFRLPSLHSFLPPAPPALSCSPSCHPLFQYHAGCLYPAFLLWWTQGPWCAERARRHFLEPAAGPHIGAQLCQAAKV